jgi:uncharacterized protein YkwD
MSGRSISGRCILRRLLPLFLFSLVASTVITAGAPSGTAGSTLDIEEQALLDLLNRYRAEQGSPPLTLDDRLTAAADWMSNDMAENGYFSHVDSLGRDPNARVAAFGYPGGVGENLARSHFFSTGQNVLNAWKQSSGHNANMLNSLWNVVGIGRAYSADWGWHWAMDLGRLSGQATPTPFSNPTADPTVSTTATSMPIPTVTPTPTPTPAPTPTSSPTPDPPRNMVGDSDCDGFVTTIDALHVLRDAAALEADAECLPFAETNCDGVIDTLDALNILRWIVRLSLATPAGCLSVGALL